MLRYSSYSSTVVSSINGRSTEGYDRLVRSLDRGSHLGRRAGQIDA